MRTHPLILSVSIFSLFYLSGCGSNAVDVPSTPNTANKPVAPEVVKAVVKPAESAVVAVPATPASAPDSKANPLLIALESNWKYTFSAEGYEGEWNSSDFDDSAWSVGKTPIGYGDDNLGTKLDDAEHKGKTLSIRARAAFVVADPAAYGALRIRVQRDDGIVIYLNGEEIIRENLPAGPLKAGTLAPKTVTGAAETELLDLPLTAGKLLAGKNVLSVAVHQNRVISTDLWFDIELTGEVK